MSMFRAAAGTAETVPASVARVAAAEPDAVALRDGGGALRYGELADASRALACALKARGIGRGDLVGNVLPRGSDRVALTLAAWRMGAAVLFLDPAWPEQRLAQLVGQARCTVVAAESSSVLTGAELFDIAAAGRIGKGAAEADLPSAATPDDIAYVIATSGSSGTPKLVEITHGNLAALVAWHNAAFAVSPEDRATHLAGLGFDAAVWEIWPYLAAGASVQIAPESVRSHAARLRDWLTESRATIAFAPTLLAEQLIRLPWRACPLRLLLTGGDRLREAPPAGLPFSLVNNYGPTECTVVACSGTVAPASEGAGLPPIGAPISGCYIRILDEAGQPVAPGEIGEIWIGGANVGRGYRDQPEATAAAFMSDPLSAEPGARLYRSGDLGRWRADGTIDFHGRIDSQLKVRGHRVEPDEVAAVLACHPQIATAAVTGMEQAGGTVLVAYIQPEPGAVPGSEDVRGFVAERLPDWAVPSVYVAVGSLPVTAHGKLDRAALPTPTDANALPRHAYAGPTNPTEERLLAILAVLMNDRSIGIDDNFFLLGGHSLLGTQVVLRAGEAFGVDLTLRHLFQAPTVRALARTVEALVEELVASMSEEEVLLRAHG